MASSVSAPECSWPGKSCMMPDGAARWLPGSSSASICRRPQMLGIPRAQDQADLYRMPVMGVITGRPEFGRELRRASVPSAELVISNATPTRAAQDNSCAARGDMQMATKGAWRGQDPNGTPPDQGNSLKAWPKIPSRLGPCKRHGRRRPSASSWCQRCTTTSSRRQHNTAAAGFLSLSVFCF